MSCILAIARLTVIESIRKRVFVAMAGFGASLVVMSALFPALDPAAQVLLLEAWAYRLIFLFGMLVAVVLAAFSIPEDVEERRIQVLLAKPVRRIDVLLGKYVGFLAVTGVFVAAMGLVSVALVRGIAALSGSDADRALAPDAVEYAAAFDPGPEAAPRQYAGRPEVFQEVRGPLDRCPEWTFDGVTRGRFGDHVRGRLRVRVGTVLPEDKRPGDFTDLVLEVDAPGRGGAGPAARVPLRVWYNRWAPFVFPSAAAEPGGTVCLRLRRPDDALWLSAAAPSLELHRDAGPLGFERNMAKALFLVLLQIAVVLSFTLAVSVFTSSLIALLGGGFFLACGTLVGFLRGALITSKLALAEMVKHPGYRPQPGEFPPWLLNLANHVTEGVLRAFPDLSQLDYGSVLVANHSVPLGSIIGGTQLAWFVLFYLFLPLAIACGIAWRKEFV